MCPMTTFCELTVKLVKLLDRRETFLPHLARILHIRFLRWKLSGRIKNLHNCQPKNSNENTATVNTLSTDCSWHSCACVWVQGFCYCAGKSLLHSEFTASQLDLSLSLCSRLQQKEMSECSSYANPNISCSIYQHNCSNCICCIHTQHTLTAKVVRRKRRFFHHNVLKSIQTPGH